MTPVMKSWPTVELFRLIVSRTMQDRKIVSTPGLHPVVAVVHRTPPWTTALMKRSSPLSTRGGVPVPCCIAAGGAVTGVVIGTRTPVQDTGPAAGSPVMVINPAFAVPVG